MHCRERIKKATGDYNVSKEVAVTKHVIEKFLLSTSPEDCARRLDVTESLQAADRGAEVGAEMQILLTLEQSISRFSISSLASNVTHPFSLSAPYKAFAEPGARSR